MTSRAKRAADAEARRKQRELAAHIVPWLPLWPWDAAQWETPPRPEKRGRGRPPKAQRPVDRMVEARGVLYRRYAKKAKTAQTVAPKAAAGRRRAGERRRNDVLEIAAQLRAEKVPPRKMARNIVEALDRKGLQVDAKHVRLILKNAGQSPAK